MKDEWIIKVGEKDPMITLQALKFISDTVRADYKDRPWPESLIEHDYLHMDPMDLPSVQDLI